VNAGAVPQRAGQRRLVLLGIALVQLLLVVLDAIVVTIALPSAQRALQPRSAMHPSRALGLGPRPTFAV
jgi:hypothetical protein